MSSVGIFICFILVLCASLILGVAINDNSSFLCYLLSVFVLTIIVIATISTEIQNVKLKKYGTYPDTTITIKNGVRDTSITYKVYEKKND